MNKYDLIYIGSPYTDVSAKVMEKRYQAILDITASLLQRGYHVISPVVHCHPLSVKHKMIPDFKFWKMYNISILRRCTLLLVVKLKGWEKSTGVSAEIAFATANKIPIEYYKGDSCFIT